MGTQKQGDSGFKAGKSMIGSSQITSSHDVSWMKALCPLHWGISKKLATFAAETSKMIKVQKKLL